MLKMDTSSRVKVREESDDLRCALRYSLPIRASASIHSPSGRKAYVTIDNLSRTGACVVRLGTLDLDANDVVLLDASDYEADQELLLSASVRWVNNLGYKTCVGLAFTEGALLPGSKFDQYLDRALLPPDSVKLGLG